MPTNEMRIVDVEDFSKKLLHDGHAQGELLVRGPHVTGRYHATDAGTFVDGWLATGDIASIDSQGYVVICDRSKDVIKSGGEWVSSKDLEVHIAGHPAIAVAAVVAAAHPKWVERPIAIVVLQSPRGTQPSVEEIRAYCSKGNTFAHHELPDDVIVWQELPMTGTGKIDKKAIRSRLAADGYTLPALRIEPPTAKL